jgi:DNA-binding GntR family transcriptional regulator
MKPPAPSEFTERDARDFEVQRQSLDEPIAAHLRDLIIRGEMAPGDKIHMPTLATALGVSTTPLREALKILADEDFVEWLPGRGVRVAPIRAEETGALFEVIAALEALAAELTASRISLAELAELEELHARMRVHFEQGERDPYFRLNSSTHQWILALSANPTLQSTHARLQGRASRGRYMAIVDDLRWLEAMQEHEALMAALRRRDPAVASETWRRHLKNTGIAVRKAQIAHTVEFR